MSQSQQRIAGKARIMLVDDHPVVRRGLATMIDSEGDMCVCGEASSAVEALRRIDECRPELVLVDIALIGPDGIELSKEIKASHPEVAMLILSMYEEGVYAERALRAGARGYVMKMEPPETILGAIRQVLRGEIYVSPALSSKLLHQVIGNPHGTASSSMERLTDRELQIFRCIGLGMGVGEIAKELYLSVKTVETHREHIKRKFGFQCSSELRRHAIRHMGTTPPESLRPS